MESLDFMNREKTKELKRTTTATTTTVRPGISYNVILFAVNQSHAIPMGN